VTTSPGAHPRIVVVEDDASMSQAIERILRIGGFATAVFPSAEAVLEAGAMIAAQCWVLDVQLPGMSGLDLYRRLALRAEVPAIVITAHDEPSIRAEAENLGVRSYLPKPFAGRALIDAVTQALRSH